MKNGKTGHHCREYLIHCEMVSINDFFVSFLNRQNQTDVKNRTYHTLHMHSGNGETKSLTYCIYPHS